MKPRKSINERNEDDLMEALNAINKDEHKALFVSKKGLLIWLN